MFLKRRRSDQITHPFSEFFLQSFDRERDISGFRIPPLDTVIPIIFCVILPLLF